MNLRDEFKALETSPKKLREFGLLVGGVFALLGGFLLWRGKESAVYFLSLGGILMVPGAVLPGVLRPLYLAWMGLALVLGWIVSRILLTVLFYFVVTPIALIARASGKKFLDLTFGESRETYWIGRKQSFERTDCEKQF